MCIRDSVYVHCTAFGTIMETDEHETSPVTDACQQLTEGLLALSARDNVPLTSAPAVVTTPSGAPITFSSAQSIPPFVGASAMPQSAVAASGVFAGQPTYNVGVVPAQPMLTAVGSPQFVVHHQQQPLNPVIMNHSGLHRD